MPRTNNDTWDLAQTMQNRMHQAIDRWREHGTGLHVVDLRHRDPHLTGH